MNLRSFSLSLVTLACLGLGPRAFAQAGNDNPGGVTAEYNGSINTAGHYDPYTGNARREIDDIVVPGAIGAYPLKYTRTFHTRGTNVWAHNYAWSMWVRPPGMTTGWEGDGGMYEGPVRGIYYPNGGSFSTITYDAQWDIDANGPHGASDMLLDCAQTAGCVAGATYELRRADGGKVLFKQSTGYKGYAIIDPYGQQTTLTYNASGKLWKVTEPGGRYLEFVYQTFTYWYPYYGTAQQPPHWVSVDMLSAVRANDGRGNITETVSYGYEWVWQGDQFPEYIPYLTHAYYDDGAQATYTYAAANSVDPTGINAGHTRRVLHTCDDPRYAGPVKQIEYEYVPWTEATGDPDFIARGQIKAEKNVSGQVVSRTTYPTSVTDPNLNKRTETRGDGPSRTFNYSVATYGVWSFIWTDFKNQPFTISHPASLYGWTKTDARGNTTTYERDNVFGALRKISYPATSVNGVTTKEYTFTNRYLHSGEKDENGNWTLFERYSNNQIKKITHPDSSTEEFTYNGFGQVETHKLRSGGTENFRYDTRGRKIEYWPPPTPSDPNPSEHKTHYTYHDAGPHADRLFMEIDPRGNATASWYNLRGQVVKVQHQDGYYTQSEYYPDGTLAWTADENHPGADTDPSQRTRYTYDEYKRVRKVTNPMGESRENWYGLDASWQNPLLHTTNNPKYTLSPMGKNVVFEYDENFRKSYQGVALGTSDANETRFDYDEVGNLTWVRDPRWNVTTFGFDQRNRKIWMDSPIASDRNSSLHSMNWVYDGVGNKTKETRADNAFRSWEYDIPNRITRAIDWRMSTAEPAVITKYERNTTSTIETTTDAKLAVYTFEFDALHRKTKATYPVDALGQARSETWHYDWTGNMDSYGAVSGNTNAVQYDNRNRPWRSTWTWGGPITVTTYDAASRVMSVETLETSVRFGYNDANRVIWEEQLLAGYPARRIEKAPDGDGNPTQLVVTTNGAMDFGVYYDYTQRNQLAHITQADHSPLYTYAYDAAGNMTMRRGDILGDATNAPSNTYDALNRPTYWEQTRGGGAWFSRSHYQYDTVGREVATWRDEDGNKGERFWFNPANHMTRAVYKADNVWTANPSGWVRFRDYHYTADLLNWTSVNDNGYLAPLASNALNQYTSLNGFVPSYDASFNQTTTYNGASFVYDALNRPVGGSMQATYDGLGRCVRRTIGGNTILFVYDGWKPVTEYDAGGSLHARNIYGPGPDELLMRGDWTYGWFFYHADKQGSVNALVDLSGNVAEKYTYDAFGRPTILSANNTQLSASAVGNRFMFTGREWLAELQLYDYRHRLYNPDNGRFLQTDPLGLQTEGVKLSAGQKALFSPGGVAPEAFSSSEMNLYRYCGDDPVDNSDPLGLEISGRVTIDYDGDPRAYAVPGSQKVGNDLLANATGASGALSSDVLLFRNGKPVTRDGYYVSMTSWQRSGNYVNAQTVPYIALGTQQQRAEGAIGTSTVRASFRLVNPANGKSMEVVFADSRGSSANNNQGIEISPAAARALGLKSGDPALAVFRGNFRTGFPVNKTGGN